MIGPYILKRVLGKGSSSVVRQAEHKDTGEQVAVKIIMKDSNPSARRKSVKAAREISILRAINHENVVKLHRTYESRTHFFLVMELVKGMELFDYLINKGRLQLAEVLVIFSQVVKGLIACHARGVVHRDLKAENILLDTEGNVKIVDFELANFVRTEPLKTFCGSSYYAPPEICAGQMYDGEKADVWSLGVLLYMMVVGEYPFDDESDAMLIRKILQFQVRFPKEIDPKVKDLIEQLLIKDPRQRISASKIPHHPVFFSQGRNLYFDSSHMEEDKSKVTARDRRVQVLENLVLELERQLLPEVQTGLSNLVVTTPPEQAVRQGSGPARAIRTPQSSSQSVSSATTGKYPPLQALAQNPDWQVVPHSSSGGSMSSGHSNQPTHSSSAEKVTPQRMEEEEKVSSAADNKRRPENQTRTRTRTPNPTRTPHPVRGGPTQQVRQRQQLPTAPPPAPTAEDPLWWLMYRSQLEVKSKDDNPIDMIKRIARASLQKNRALGVGGMLYCDRKTGRIIQILEGRRSVLKQLAAAIMMDTRHSRFMIIKNEPVAERRFKDWGMSFANTLSSFQRNRMAPGVAQRAPPQGSSGGGGDEKLSSPEDDRSRAKRPKQT
ncbi:hypothetical protein AAMO2058_000964400 [Amorphochlora amoebiformis]